MTFIKLLVHMRRVMGKSRRDLNTARSTSEDRQFPVIR